MSVIKVKPWGAGQGDFVLIEEDDFDPEKHVPFGDEPADTEEKKPAKRGPKPKSAE